MTQPPSRTKFYLDKRNGKERWRALDGEEPGYCAPVIFEVGGRRQLVVWHPAAVASLDPADGSLLWQVPFNVQAGMTIATPRRTADRLFVTSFYSGPLMIDLGRNGRSPDVLWRTAANSNDSASDRIRLGATSWWEESTSTSSATR